MKKIQPTIAILTLLFLSQVVASAQQFKWVTGGGTNYNATRTFDWEQVEKMCTDPNGNVYALSNVGPNAIYADTFYRSGAYGQTDNIMLTSYTCNGQMRWAKLIATSSDISVPDGILADSIGHIYVAAYMPGATAHIGYDTTIFGSANQSSTLMQFDTSGHFNWMRYVGDNSWTTFAETGFYGCIPLLDASNNVHFLNDMGGGVHITSTLTSVAGTYDLVYNPSGTLLSATRLDLDTQWYLTSAAFDKGTNQIYATGQPLPEYTSTGYPDTFFAAKFDAASGSKIWQYYCNMGGAVTGVVINKRNDLVFCGYEQGGFFAFNRDTTRAATSGNASIVMRTDTNGTVKWISRFDSYFAINDFPGITLLPNDKVAVVGTLAGALISGIDSIPSYSGWIPDVVIVDSAGDVQAMQGLPGDGFYNEGNAITSDKYENIYVGGLVEDTIIQGTSIPAYHSIGGNSDFFIAKYGVDCNCTYMPIASFTDTGHHTVGVTYTGTTAGIDSVVWNFGDTSATVTGLTALHTYTYTGTYRVCATVYTGCGNDIYCTDVFYQTTTGTPYPVQGDVHVFPNPANDLLNITGIQQQTNYRLLSVTGMCMSQGMLQRQVNTIPMSNLASGIYILEMTGEDGQRNIVRVVKE